MLYKKILLSGFILSLCIGLTACNNTVSTGQNGNQAPSVQVVEPSVLKTLLPDTVGQGKPVIVDVYSQYCLACQQISPKLDKTVETHPEVTLKRVDMQKTTPQEKDLIQKLGVATVPHVAFITGEGVITKVILEDAPQTEVDALTKALNSNDQTPAKQ